MRTIVLTLVLAVSTVLPALETPLVIRPPEAGATPLMAVINPSSGTLQLYSQGARELKLETEINFLAYLNYLIKVPADMKNLAEHQNWPLLRIGTLNNKPHYQEMINTFSDREGEDGQPSLRARVKAAEDAYWERSPSYDGVVRGAMTDQSLMLAIPSCYCILMFRFQRPELIFAGVHNYRPELYVPTEFQSYPSSSELFSQLPEEVQRKHQKLQERLESAEEDAGTMRLAESDPWLVATGQRGRFLMLDPANDIIVVYEYVARGKLGEMEIKSVRNMTIELMVPTGMNTIPDMRRLLRDYNQQLRRADQGQVSAAYLRKLAAVKAVTAEATSAVHANLDDNGVLFVNNGPANKLLIYDAHRGRADQLELKAIRDYTLEVGIAVHRQRIIDRQNAAVLLERVERRVNKKTVEESMRLLKLALEWDPRLYQEAERDRKIRRYLGDHAEWETVIVKSAEAAEALAQEEKRIAEELAAEQAND